MTKAGDDLEAVRDVVATLERFDNENRERIIRWAREKLGMTIAAVAAPAAAVAADAGGGGAAAAATPAGQPKDIKSFIDQKKPKSDQQLAAVVAYFHQFIASAAERKDSITPEDLIDACRLADWQRPASAKQTLVNAFTVGYLDRPDRGHYRLNSVGENLVAMALPDTGDGTTNRRAGRGGRSIAKKARGKVAKTKGKKRAVSSPRK